MAANTSTKRAYAAAEHRGIYDPADTNPACGHSAPGIQKPTPGVMTGEIIRKGVQPYGIVPFSLLEFHTLPPLARLVAVWIESKPEGWIVRPGVLQKALGITEKQWLSARKAMIKAGIFTHRKHRKANGKWAWTSEFDASSIVATIPPLAVHGEGWNIDIRDKEIRSKQNTEVIRACAPNDPSPVSRLASRENYDLHKLKKMHISHVLHALGIGWEEKGDYICWDDKSRARKADDGHWLWYRVDEHGEDADGSGSAIDLIMDNVGCSQAEAINHLRRIYKSP